jgi:histidine triad (HIT) family protein
MSVDPRDPECIFCQIIAGIRPAEIVFESPTTVAFLDRFPAARGHTLVVPRRHAPTLLDLDEGGVGALFGSVVEVVERLSGALHPAGFNVGWNHGEAAGQHVFHLHVHVLPRFRDGGPGVQAAGEGSPEGPLSEIAEVIRGGGALRSHGRRPFAVVPSRR